MNGWHVEPPAKLRHKREEKTMTPSAKYVIERDIPRAGAMSKEDLRAASQNSCNVLRNLGPDIQWLESYVSKDKIYCVYIAPNEDMIHQHAREAGLPANRISKVETIIDPTTATG